MTPRAGSPAQIEVVTRAPGVLQVRLGGSVDLRAVRRLRDELERLLDPTGRPVRMMEIDLSSVEQCDFRALGVLDDARRELLATRAGFAVRGLDPAVLTFFADAGLLELFRAYRASRDIARTGWPAEAGGRAVRGAFSPADARLVRTCLDLATAQRTPSGSIDVAAVTGALVTLCERRFGVDAAVVLVGSGRRPGRWAVAAASTEGARLLAVAGLAADHGPVAQCLHHGRPVSVPDVSAEALRWPRYVRTAHGHGVLAARALPLHLPSRSAPTGVLALFSSTSGPMAAADLLAAQAFADLAAVALGAGGPAQPDDEPTQRAATPQEQILVEQAVGVIGETHRLGPAEARDLLHGYARSRAMDPAAAARAIVARAAAPSDVVRPSGASPGQ